MSRADKRARRIAEHLEWLRAQGRTEAKRGGQWHPMTVARVLQGKQ